MNQKESQIESYLKIQIEKIGGMCLKWVSPGNRGVPDRIVFINSQIWFIELKSTTGERSKLQIYFERLIRKYTDSYLVISSKEEVNKFVGRFK